MLYFFVSKTDIYVLLPKSSDDDAMNLEFIRESLMTQDNRIFYSLLERSELPMNLETYSKESCEVPGFNGSLMDFIMQETEKAHARVSQQSICYFVQ